MSEKVTLNLYALHEDRRKLSFGNRIEAISQKGDNYYDLYNKAGILCCMDGEKVTVLKRTKTCVKYLNEEGENPVEFKLNRSESEIAEFI